jgi:hypothetical protein
VKETWLTAILGPKFLLKFSTLIMPVFSAARQGRRRFIISDSSPASLFNRNPIMLTPVWTISKNTVQKKSQKKLTANFTHFTDKNPGEPVTQLLSVKSMPSVVSSFGAPVQGRNSLGFLGGGGL